MSEALHLTLIALAACIGAPLGFLAAAGVDRWWERRKRSCR